MEIELAGSTSASATVTRDDPLLAERFPEPRYVHLHALLGGVGGLPSQMASISRSEVTGLPRARSSSAKRARCLVPPRLIGRPSWSASIGPSMRNSNRPLLDSARPYHTADCRHLPRVRSGCDRLQPARRMVRGMHTRTLSAALALIAMTAIWNGRRRQHATSSGPPSGPFVVRVEAGLSIGVTRGSARPAASGLHS